jgi:hypothetical protein
MLALLLTLLVGCNAPTSADTNPTPSYKPFTALSTVDEQAVFFETQLLIAKDQLGIEVLDLPPVNARSSTKGSSGFTWHNPHGYLTDVPTTLRPQLESAYQQAVRSHPELTRVTHLFVAEYSQLVPKSQQTAVTSDVLAFVVVKGIMPSGRIDWIGNITVRLNDWTIRGYSINPVLMHPSTTQIDQWEFIPASAWLPRAYSTRRVIDDALYTKLNASGRLPLTQSLALSNLGELPVVGITSDGEIEMMNFEGGITDALIESCEQCQYHLLSCPEQ